ncbi:MAG: LptF/LptG family permease, partial [Armatimonadota bacterium]|nr:LptF/LptG family permease [Armatimonadota bacterium]
MKILDRYLIRELVPPFFFGVAMFTSLFLGAAILPTLAKLFVQGGTLVEVGWLFALSLPQVVGFTVPMAVLLATLLGMMRLSSESEIVAILAGGISLRRISVPILAFAVVVAVFAYFFQDLVVPQSAKRYYLIVDTIRKRTQIELDESQVKLIPEPEKGPPRFIVYARRVRVGAAQGKGDPDTVTLVDVTIIEKNKEGRTQGLWAADEARYEVKTGDWSLVRAVYYNLLTPERLGRNAAGAKDVPPIEIKGLRVDLGPPKEFIQPKRRPDEMSLAELRQMIVNSRRNGLPTSQYEMKIHQRFAVPFAAVVFALVGVPLGLRRQRGG